MRTLLEQTLDERKQFALTEVQHIAEWSDIHSTDDFEMEENKGGLIFLPLMIRRSNEHYLSSVEEIEP